jgi:hypothetical protein
VVIAKAIPSCNNGILIPYYSTGRYGMLENGGDRSATSRANTDYGEHRSVTEQSRSEIPSLADTPVLTSGLPDGRWHDLTVEFKSGKYTRVWEYHAPLESGVSKFSVFEMPSKFNAHHDVAEGSAGADIFVYEGGKDALQFDARGSAPETQLWDSVDSIKLGVLLAFEPVSAALMFFGKLLEYVLSSADNDRSSQNASKHFEPEHYVDKCFSPGEGLAQIFVDIASSTISPNPAHRGSSPDNIWTYQDQNRVAGLTAATCWRGSAR